MPVRTGVSRPPAARGLWTSRVSARQLGQPDGRRAVVVDDDDLHQVVGVRPRGQPGQHEVELVLVPMRRDHDGDAEDGVPVAERRHRQRAVVVVSNARLSDHNAPRVGRVMRYPGRRRSPTGRDGRCPQHHRCRFGVLRSRRDCSGSASPARHFPVKPLTLVHPAITRFITGTSGQCSGLGPPGAGEGADASGVI